MAENYHKFQFICLTLVFFLASPAWAWTGKVVGVADGDTITVMHQGKGERIRLYGIDCPERSQDFGRRAKQFTSDLVFGKVVEVEAIDQDRYGRTVGMVYINCQSVNAAIIKAGYAWVYRKYCRIQMCSDWMRLEILARGSKVGLWSHPDPVPPWDFRRGERSSSRSNRSVGAAEAFGVYHGNVNSKVFHRQGCRYYNCKNCTAEFMSREEAIAAGNRPCGICRP